MLPFSDIFKKTLYCHLKELFLVLLFNISKNKFRTKLLSLIKTRVNCYCLCGTQWYSSLNLLLQHHLRMTLNIFGWRELMFLQVEGHSVTLWLKSSFMQMCLVIGTVSEWGNLVHGTFVCFLFLTSGVNLLRYLR